MNFEPESVAKALRKSWSKDTAKQWSRERPAAGSMQCDRVISPRSLWRRTPENGPPAGDHSYNRIDGVRYDFTASQFDAPIAYADTTAAPTDAKRGATSAELLALRTAFMRQFGPSG